ncbi:MAG: hypothetical protein LBP76_08690 [Treponema sp.]|jgi:hypothetical protein|nr:hypothetical protein [Treponema sp.]
MNDTEEEALQSPRKNSIRILMMYEKALVRGFSVPKIHHFHFPYRAVKVVNLVNLAR